MVNWRFSGLEFQLLLSAYGRDRLPYPLQFRPDAIDFDDLVRQREAAVDALLGRHSLELERALGVLLEPEVRIESKGFDGPDLARTLRFHAAINGSAATTLTQLPGRAADTGSDVIMRYGPASGAAALLVAALPDTSAGTAAPIEVRRAEVAADRDRTMRSSARLGLTEQLDRLFKRERLGLGEITVSPGAAVDSRPTFGRAFWWMDYPDGRYYVKTGDPIVARPMDGNAMAAEINQLAALTLRYYREDREHDESLRQSR